MASRRMFSPQIVCSDDFIDMPVSSRDLYYQLAIRADDDGFVQPKTIMRIVGAGQDDLKVLITKRFLLPFESGVVVVKHWLIHNMIRADRYTETRFVSEKNTLYIRDDKAYTDNPETGVPLLATKRQPNVNQMVPQVRLGKDRLGNSGGAKPPQEIIEVKEFIQEKGEKSPNKTTSGMKQVFSLFLDNPARAVWKLRKIERDSAQVLFDEFGIEELAMRYETAKKHQGEDMCPQINTPAEFLDKMPNMENFLKKLRV